MIWSIFDFTDTRGKSVIQQWADDIRLEERDRGRLDLRIDLLEKNGEGLSTEVLAGTRKRHIKKIKVKGRIQLRPLLCRGPFTTEQNGVHTPERGFTFLLGAVEKDWEFVPQDALERAEANRTTLLADFSRRIKHERLSRQTKRELSE